MTGAGFSTEGGGHAPQVGPGAPCEGSVVLDLGGPGEPTLRVGAAGEEPPGPPLGLDAWLGRHVWPADAAEVRSAVAAAVATGGDLDVTYRDASPDAPVAWIRLRAARTERAGRPGPAWVGATQDVTAVVRAAEARVHRGHAEAQRRARNTLAATRALLRLGPPGSPEVEAFQALAEGRVSALARVLVGVGRDGEAGLPVDAILWDELLAAALDARRARTDGPRVLLPFQAAQAMALAFHDLAVIALGHGTLDGREGDLEVRWRVEGEAGTEAGSPPAAALLLDWTERAPGLPPSLPDGVRMDLLERMLGYGPGGSVRAERGEGRFACRIRLPLRGSAG